MNNYYGNSWADDARPSEHLPLNVVNAFLQRVFLTMGAGLAITGLAAYYFFKLFFIVDGGSIAGLTQVGQSMLGGPMMYVIMFAPLVFVLIMSFGINKMSSTVATVLFGAYALVNGISFSVILAMYTAASVATTFFVTAGAFIALALYGLTTKSDLSKLGSIAMMGLFGIIIASLVNWFVGSSTMDFIISIIGVLVFTALTAYDVQKIMRVSLTLNADSEEARKASIMGALNLYLDFINLFLFLLKLLGSRRD